MHRGRKDVTKKIHLSHALKDKYNLFRQRQADDHGSKALFGEIYCEWKSGKRN